jgi:hypothetical protein
MASLAVVAGLTFARRDGPPRNIVPVETKSAAGDLSGARYPEVAADDASLALLADLTGDLDWDDAMAAGISVRAGETDTVLADLTELERAELERLLNEAMRSSGA